MVIVVVGLCIIFCSFALIYFVLKHIIDMNERERKMPDPPVNPDPGDGGGGGNDDNPDPGDKK